MSDTAAAQLRRILDVIPLLAEDRPHRLADIAARAGVDPRTLFEDLHTLAERYDEPGGFVDGLQVYLEAERVHLVSGHFRRPMRITVPELCAIELGLALLRAGSAPEEHEVIDRARDRLRAIIARLPSESLADRVYHAVLGTPGDAEHLAAVRTALAERRKLRLAYRKSGTTRPSERTVLPCALVAASGSLYLVAHCERERGPRIFRLDRIERAMVLDERYELPASVSLDEIVHNGRVLQGETAVRLRVRYSPRVARWIAEREGLSPAADGSLEAEYPLADIDWGVRHVLQYGPEAEVVSPVEVRREVRRRLESMLGKAPARARGGQS